MFRANTIFECMNNSRSLKRKDDRWWLLPDFDYVSEVQKLWTKSARRPHTSWTLSHPQEQSIKGWIVLGGYALATMCSLSEVTRAGIVPCGFTAFGGKWSGLFNKSLFRALLERWDVTEGSSSAHLTFTTDSPPPNANRRSQGSINVLGSLGGPHHSDVNLKGWDFI